MSFWTRHSQFSFHYYTLLMQGCDLYLFRNAVPTTDLRTYEIEMNLFVITELDRTFWLKNRI
uniref:Uncharacterized protein n=1 Tax=Meloidogyne enterolobii TaxID=390850 RepID=A0A6V7UYD5_MELEN|nr:unnamed protein product [Meloidogyne enterolobii]